MKSSSDGETEGMGDMKQLKLPVVMTIAGSDSGGGAGIQADLKTFAVLDVFGTTAVTCVTAQNPRKIARIAPVSPDMVSLQIKTVCEAFRVSAAKTGMLYSGPIIRVVARAIAECRIRTLVVDPVMIATSGTRLLKPSALKALCSDLLPMATVITPNIGEAEMLCGHVIHSLADMEIAATEIGERFGTACVIKGGHLRLGVRCQVSGVRGHRTEIKRLQVDVSRTRHSTLDNRNSVVDILYDGKTTTAFSLPRIASIKTHGTGCTFSAALTAFLAHGERLAAAVEHAKLFVHGSLRRE